MYGFGVVGGLDQQTKFFSFLGRYNNGFTQNSYALIKVILDNEIHAVSDMNQLTN